MTVPSSALVNAIDSQFEANNSPPIGKKLLIKKKLYYILDNSHTYSCTTVEQWCMAVMLWTVLVGQPLYSTVQHDLSIKNKLSAVDAWAMNEYPAEFWLPQCWSVSAATTVPPTPSWGIDKLPATVCAVYCCEIMNRWNGKVIQKTLMSFSMLASWSQPLLPFMWCKETSLIYKRNKQFSESYIVHSRANWLTYWQGCVPHCPAARMTTALFYITVTISKLVQFY